MKKDKKDKVKSEGVEEDKITLPALFGVEPGVYLAVLYGVILLLVLFFVLVIPGIINPGSAAVCSSEPSGAAVRIDDLTYGYTPCTIFIPQGKRVIEFILPGFEPDRHELEIKGRLFGSLILPRKIPVTGNLVTKDPAGAFALSALDYIHWSAFGEASEAWQQPLSLSDGAYRTGPAAKDPVTRKAMQDILDGSLNFAVSKAAARDILRAHFLVDNAGLSPSPLTLIRAMQTAAARMGKSPAGSYLAEILPPEYASLINESFTESAWYQKDPSLSQTGGAPSGETLELTFRFPSSLMLEGTVFTAVNAGYHEKYGKAEVMPPMLLAAAPVTQAAWDAFTAETPYWAADNRQALIAAGLAEEPYLLPVESSVYPEPAAPGISWYAAAAYCRWLTGKLPPSLAGWELRLPSEAEWEYAIQRSGHPSGSLWEWCADPYTPLDFFPLSREAQEILEREAGNSSFGKALERSVRGGSWINLPGSVNQDSRGSLPPQTSSPFVGFRPVIVPKQGS